ncbi:MAG: FkbM family methyltransferase [Burkholderiales bacterium]
MKVGIIIPVGPGHELLAEDAQDSVAEAFATGSGPFDAYTLIAIDDTQGRLGRSAARNLGVVRAGEQDCEWVFFLDADDLLHANAFRTVRAALAAGYDAVWGAICELAADEQSTTLRAGQMEKISGVGDLLGNDPWTTLQMGHFVRRTVAERTPFAAHLDCGEDFDYYYRVWSAHRCCKLREPLFLNRRGLHSTGPRAATDAQWRLAVEAMIVERCRATGFHRDFTHRGERFRFFVDDPFDPLQRQHLQGRFGGVEGLDAVAARRAAGGIFLDVGAHAGNRAVYLGRFLAPQCLIVLEPNPPVADLLARNLAANAIAAETRWIGLAAGAAAGRGILRPAGRHHSGEVRVEAAAGGPVDMQPLDALELGAVDFLMVDVAGDELEVLAGARGLLARCRPALCVAVAPARTQDFAAWCDSAGYAVTLALPQGGVAQQRPQFYLEPRH